MSTALIIGVLNPKGGSGKTTLATNIARGIQLEGLDTLLVDTDPQGTARDWHRSQNEGSELPNVVGIDTPKALEGEIERLSQSYDIVVMDGSAKLEKMLGACVRVSDAVLVPVQPTPADVWGAKDLVDVIRRTPDPPRAAFVVSRQIVGTNLADEVEEALEGYEFPVFSGRTSQRVAYAEAMIHGSTVLDDDPDGKAAQEIDAILDDLLDLIHE